jgi:hypothetical protein
MSDDTPDQQFHQAADRFVARLLRNIRRGKGKTPADYGMTETIEELGHWTHDETPEDN